MASRPLEDGGVSYLRTRPRSPLEAQLTTVTQEFVFRLVEIIRNASFADVAGLGPPTTPGRASQGGGRRGPRRAPLTDEVRTNHVAKGTAVRQTKAHRAELGEQILKTLRNANHPLGVRALSDELGVSPDHLANPLRELRADGRIQKHGDKRSTTYSTS